MNTPRRQKTAVLLIVFAVAFTVGVILSLRQGSATNSESLVTPVDVSDEDLKCYMQMSPGARTQAKGDVNRARMLWFVDWSVKGFVVHCPRTTGAPQDLTDKEAFQYLHGYFDLKKLFVNDIQAVKKHWKEVGYKEGRVIPAPPVPIENKIISIRSGESGRFCGTSASTQMVWCNKSSVTDTERYVFEKVEPNLMVLKGYASNKYCSFVPGKGLVCDKNTVTDAERFLYNVYGRCGLAFKSAKSKLFCGDRSGKIICKDLSPGLGEFFYWKEEVPPAIETKPLSGAGTIQPSSAATSTTAVTQTLTKEQELHNRAFAECARTRSEAECAQLMGPPVTQTAASTFVTQSAASTSATQTLTKEQERHNNAFAECARTRSEAECAQFMGPPVTQTAASTFVTQSAASTSATQTLAKEQERLNNLFAECARTRSEAECAQLMGLSPAVLESNARNNAIAAANTTAAASHLNAENAAKLAKTSAANAEQALKDAKAASVAACAASKKTTENLKLKINGTLTKFETFQLDILASNTSETASKALAIVVQAESAVKDAKLFATEAASAAEKAFAAHKVVMGVIVSAQTGAEASHQTNATKAAELAVQFANEAETALSKARIAEQKALGTTTSMAIMQSDQNIAEQKAIVDAAKKAEEAKKVEAQPPAANAANAAKAAVVKTSEGLKSLTDRIIDSSSSVDVKKVVETVVITANAVAEVTKSVANNTAAVEKETVQKTTAAVVINNNALDTNAKAIGNTVDVVKATNGVVLESKDMEGAKNNVKAASDTAIAATGNAEAAGKNAKSAAENATTAKKEGTAAEAEAAAKAAAVAAQLALEAKAKADAATKASQEAQKVIVEVAKVVVKDTTPDTTIQANSETVSKPVSQSDVATREQARAKLVQEEDKALMDKQMASKAAMALKVLQDKQASDAAAKSKIVITSSNNNTSILVVLVAGMVGTYALYRYRRSKQ